LGHGDPLKREVSIKVFNLSVLVLQSVRDFYLRVDVLLPQTLSLFQNGFLKNYRPIVFSSLYKEVPLEKQLDLLDSLIRVAHI
jgi:hypothetical protein